MQVASICQSSWSVPESPQYQLHQGPPRVEGVAAVGIRGLLSQSLAAHDMSHLHRRPSSLDGLREDNQGQLIPREESSAPDHGRRGPHLPPLQEPSREDYQSSKTTQAGPRLWSGGMPTPLFEVPPERLHTARSHHGPELGSSREQQQYPDHRRHPSYPETPRSDHMSSREQLPPVSSILTSESPVPTSQSPFSPHWSGESSISRISPRQSPAAGAINFGRPPLQSSPTSYHHPLQRLPSYSGPSSHDPPPLVRQLSGHSSRTPTASEGGLLSPPSPYDRQQAYRYPDVPPHPTQWPRSQDPLPPMQQTSPHPLPATSHPLPVHSQETQPFEAPRGPIGPRIWTGSYFLPRFQGEANVPGEGPCYFYDDGTHCKTTIDGEAVNAHWGVTKAGKPRKRLAVACLTCREKKIKCDPDYPKCIQCEKFRRICRFKNVPRGQRGSPEQEAKEFSTGIVPPLIAGSTAEAGAMVKSRSLDERHLAKDRKRRLSDSTGRETSPVSEFDPIDLQNPVEQHHAKRRRQSSPIPSLFQHLENPMSLAPEKPVRASLPGGLSGSGFRWQSDPYKINPELVDHLLNLYFTCVNSSILAIFPREAFTAWTRECDAKSTDDLMLLYTMLKLAASFSNRPDRRSFSRDFARISRYAIDSRLCQYSLQLVQSKLLLSLSLFAMGKNVDAWHFSGSAIRTAMGLKYNVEDPTLLSSENPDLAYGLSPIGLSECRRRTFWATYLMDRLGGFWSAQIHSLQEDDIFVRLPSDEASFEAQREVNNATFDRYLANRSDPSSFQSESLGPMAYLVQISSIWSDVMAHTYRSRHGSTDKYGGRYEEFYERSQTGLRQWMANLPKSLLFTPETLDMSIKDNTLGVLVIINTIYHATQMRLHRNVRAGSIEQDRINSNVVRARQHAHELFNLTQALANRRDGPQDLRQAYVNPVLGYAITMAVDILTTKGIKDDIPQMLRLLKEGIQLLEEMRPFWSSANDQKTRLDERAEILQAVFQHDSIVGDNAAVEGKAFSMLQPLLDQASGEEDLMFDLSLGSYLSAVSNQGKGAGE